MELRKEVSVDKIEVDQLGCVNVRTATSVYQGDELIARSFHRHVITPGDDFSGESDKVKEICATAHTDEAISSYKLAIAPKEI